MSEMQQDNSATSNMPQTCSSLTGPNKIMAEYLAEKSSDFARLEAARTKGWGDSEADKYWQNRRAQADAPSDCQAQAFYEMTKQIAKEWQEKTGALTLVNCDDQPPQVLDLCMAPGGFTWGALEQNPNAVAYGITLPIANGGYKNWYKLPAEYVSFMDVTMLAKEFGRETIPASHADHSLFLADRPFLDQRFQLIFCGGAVLRTHERSEHRQKLERTRLTTSQLILAMQRILPGGTMVVLLRRPDSHNTAHLLQQFNSFAQIKLFKPRKKHSVRSSFYLVAKNVQPDAATAKAALEEWKESWSRATFGGDEGVGEDGPKMNVKAVQTMLDEFGPELLKLADPVWRIQADALERQNFTKFPKDGSRWYPRLKRSS